MSVFRKRPKGFVMPSPCHSPVRDLRILTTLENGNEVTKEVVIDCPVSDFFLNHPICTEEFSLKEQLQAGVQVKEIPCSTMLDSGDNLDYVENDFAEQKALEIIENSESNNND